MVSKKINDNVLVAEHKIKNLLRSLTSVDPVKLTNWLVSIGFFVCPASTRFHGAYSGGLLVHSLGVFKLFKVANQKYNLHLSSDDIVICGLLHDVCKCGAYVRVDGVYKWNKNHPRGHAKLSVSMLKKVFPLSQVQEKIICYHMGMYGAVYDNSWINEYSVKELVQVFSNYPATKFFYFCDELSTMNEKIMESGGCLG